MGSRAISKWGLFEGFHWMKIVREGWVKCYGSTFIRHLWRVLPILSDGKASHVCFIQFNCWFCFLFTILQSMTNSLASIARMNVNLHSFPIHENTVTLSCPSSGPSKKCYVYLVPVVHTKEVFWFLFFIFYCK